MAHQRQMDHRNEQYRSRLREIRRYSSVWRGFGDDLASRNRPNSTLGEKTSPMACPWAHSEAIKWCQNHLRGNRTHCFQLDSRVGKALRGYSTVESVLQRVTISH